MSICNSILAIAITIDLVFLCGIDVSGGSRVMVNPSDMPAVGCAGRVGSDDENDMESNSRWSGCSNSSSTEVDHHQSPSSEQWEKRQRNKHTRLFTVQREILERLGIRRPPNITHSNLTPQDLERFQEVLRQTENQDRTIYQRDFYAKRFQTVLPSCTLPRNSDSLWDEATATEMRLYFPFEQIVMTHRHRETKIFVASLKLRKKSVVRDEKLSTRRHSNASNEDSIIRITVYAYTKPVKRGRREQKKVINTLFVNRYSGLMWTRIDVRMAVEDWMRRSNRNHGLQLTVESDHKLIDPYEIFERFDCNSRAVASTSVLTFPISEVESSETNEPLDLESSRKLPAMFLDVVTVDVPRRRSSRNYRDLQSNNQRSSCGLEKMFISFAELGWSDWIVQPKGFETGFCRGSCAKRTTPRTTNRKFSADLTSLGLSDCCGPVRAKALSVLQYNEKDKLSISVFDDFIVTECGCRR